MLPGEVLLLGSASRHLLCSPFSWERAFEQNLLGGKCASALCAGFPALRTGRRRCWGARSPLDGTCEMLFPPSLPSQQEGLMVYLEIWEPEESSTVVGLSNCLSKTASRAAEPAATATLEPVPSQTLGFPSLRTLLLSIL